MIHSSVCLLRFNTSLLMSDTGNSVFLSVCLSVRLSFCPSVLMSVCHVPVLYRNRNGSTYNHDFCST